MPALTIRAAAPADLPRLTDLWYEKMVLVQQADSRLRLAPDARARWLAAAGSWLDEDRASLYVAEGESVVGYIVARVQPGSPGVLPDQVGVIAELALDAHGYYPGAGRQLVSAACAWLRSQGIDQIQVQVSRRHAVEQAFWRALGAKDWMDCLWMTC